MLCLFEPRTPPRGGTQSVWLQLWRRRQKYQMPVVPGWHRPLPLSSGSLLGSADADFLLSTTRSENISAVTPVRGAIVAPHGGGTSSPTNNGQDCSSTVASFPTGNNIWTLDASLRLKKSDIFICACKEF